MADMENISIRIESEKKQKINIICKKDDITLSVVVRNYLNTILENNSTKIINIKSENDENFKDILELVQKDNNKIINILKDQVLEKDKQLENKDTTTATILDKIQEDNNKIANMLRKQLEEKDKQLAQKNKLIENMQVLMKDNQLLLKEEQSKNFLLLENKNNKNKISWFPFFRNKNI